MTAGTNPVRARMDKTAPSIANECRTLNPLKSIRIEQSLPYFTITFCMDSLVVAFKISAA